MFDTSPNASSRRGFAGPARLVLGAAAAFTLLAGGTALAAESTSSGTHTGQAPAAQLLLGNNPSIFKTQAQTESQTESQPETAGSVKTQESDSAADASEPSAAAEGVHGACVSAVARDESTVGRDHGAAVAEAAHSCAKGSEDVSDDVSGEAEGSEAEDGAKSAAHVARDAAKSAAHEVRDATKSAAHEVRHAAKSAAHEVRDATKSSSEVARDAAKSAADAAKDGANSEGESHVRG
jgi:hypothetical protein